MKILVIVSFVFVMFDIKATEPKDMVGAIGIGIAEEEYEGRLAYNLNAEVPGISGMVGATCTWNGGGWVGSCTGSGGYPGTDDDVVIDAVVLISQCGTGAATALYCNSLEINDTIVLNKDNDIIQITGTYIDITIDDAIVSRAEKTGCYIQIAAAGNIDLGAGAAPDATLDSLIIQSGVRLKVTSGTLRTDQGTPTAKTGLVIKPGAWVGDGLENIDGAVTVHQTGRATTTSWNLWGTPVKESGANQFKLERIITAGNLNSGLGSGMYYYIYGHTGKSGWVSVCSGCGNSDHAIVNMVPGRGYSVMGVSNGSSPIKFFKGPLYNDATTNIATGAPTSGYGLIANPYAGYLDLQDFVTHANNKDEITEIAYLWINDNTTGSGYDGSDYATVNNGGVVNPANSCDITPPYCKKYISPGQGFFVEFDAAGDGTLHFDRDAMLQDDPGADAGGFVRKMAPDTLQVIRLNLVDSVGKHSVMTVYFSDSATMSFDKGQDAKKVIIDGNIGIYSLIQNEPYVIQALPKPAFTQIIPLGLITNMTGDFTINIRNTENLPAGTTLFLEDLDNNVMHDLNSFDYIVNLPQDTFDNRFLLHVGSLATKLEETNKEDYIITYVKGKHLFIDGLRNLGTIMSLEIFDISGRCIDRKEYNRKLSSIELKKLGQGLNIIRINSEKGVTVKKIFM